MDQSVIMPNHIHGIIVLTGDRKSVHEHFRRGVQLNARTDTHAYYSSISPHGNTLSVIVRTFKGAVTNWCRTNGFQGFSWQRNFHDHIIRNQISLESIREYVYYNALKWHLDGQNPDRTGTDGFEEWLNGEKDEAWAFN
jgi:REP element-mobilizing transposase RayT